MAKQYTIGQLAKLSGVGVHTLRNWEKRYVFIDSKKDQHGHHYYSEDDLKKVIALKVKVDSGITPSKAIKLLQKEIFNEHEPYKFQRIKNFEKMKKDVASKFEKRSLNLDSILKLLEAKKDEISRVCISKSPFLDNELIVLESEEFFKSQSDLMAPYYRCYVSKDSSLKKLTKSSVRVFSLTDNVLHAFQNRAPQKSIEYISRVGHKSGLCLACYVNGKVLGYIYLNSPIESYFDEWHSEESPLLAELSIVSQQILMQELDEIQYWQKKKKSSPSLSGIQSFTEKAFLENVFSLIPEGHINKNAIYLGDLDKNFLYRPLPLFDFLKILLDSNKGQLRLEVKNNLQNVMKLSFKKIDYSSDTSWSLPDQEKIKFHKSYGLQYLMARDEISVFYPIESKFTKEHYSKF